MEGTASQTSDSLSELEQPSANSNIEHNLQGTSAEAFQDFYDNCSPIERKELELESKILIECKVCGEIFRDFSYFVSHKRTFCRDLPGAEVQDSRKLTTKAAGRPHKKPSKGGKRSNAGRPSKVV
ncbi:unnamed protein product [Cylicocyclus nassatus]|uniref:C2H2-type domain-containing protein n=1 Tax=Cylicocyclus nassatus TaxID=53992 RepID=A0AA36DUV3_CYLNA|nr:unnamed protein product [Cylicocyclus nassatus]